ncbi:A-kinase anchor protein 1, mitochondrial [Centrocercus urophasianus]|uniref:A-kinase anchor protein 1, mitochondrial n=1 Tax=Centrocercus urophasianus TaxID=9002 RepID=UPI001C64C199|nr:A-kinase anchor protein 1, mitochondrial [Centrocercus urophasianus]
MALRFRTFFPYAIPGVLALLGCWWIYSHRKKHPSNRNRQAIAIAEEKQKELPENDSPPKTEACVPQRLPLSPEEERPENETSTSLLLAGPMTPSLMRQTRERLDFSRDLSAPAIRTTQPSTVEDDSEKLEIKGSQDESSVPACVSLPLISKSAKYHSDAAVSPEEDSGSSANQSTCPSASLVLTQGSLGITEEISNAEQSDESSFKPPKESQMPEIALSDTGCVTALHLGLEKEADTPQAILSNEVVSSHQDSAVRMLSDSLESACLEQSREEKISESNDSTVPVCQGEDTHAKGNELERERIRGVSLDKEEVEKIEQVAIQIISKVILAATEEVLSGSVSDVSSRICQAAASRVERPQERASTVSSDQLLAGEAGGADENTALKSDAAVPTSLPAEEHDQCVTYSSCLALGHLSSPVQGDTQNRQEKNCVHSESQRVDRTLVASHGGSLGKSCLVMEDSGCSMCASEGGTSVEDPLQNTMLSVASGQHSDLLSTSTAQDTSAEQSSEPSEKPPTLKLPEDSKVPYSNGTLKEDGSDSRHEGNWAAEMDGDHSGGSDVNSMDSVDSGCALGKTETRQNSKPGGESSKSDLTIWEIEVPKHLVGRLIGKQGRYVSFLKQTSGAKIYISTLPYSHDFQICHIEGSQHHVEKALSLIGKKFKELSLTNIYAPPPPSLALHSLPMTSWLMLPDGVTVEVVVANQVNAGHMFLQQHTHPTFHVLRSLDQQMYVCYSQPGIPTLPTPVEVGIICAAPGLDGAWWRAQVVGYFKDSSEVEIRYVDYGGYERVKIDTLRQIRSDFVTLPFQGAEVLLDNVVPLPDEDHFSSEADAAVSEMTRGAALLAQVTNYDSATGLPLIQLWSMMGDEVVSINRTLVERGFAQWVDNY